MQEPAPRKIQPPQLEPTIRVGLILQEDNISSVDFNSEGVFVDTEKSALSKGTILLKGDNELSIKDKTERNLTNKIKLEPQISKSLAPKMGIHLDPVIAGRNFHWKKNISATYPGSLEFQNKSGAIEAINEVSFEDYLACVVTSEMGAECPIEFMKAQIVAARSWAYVFLHDKHPDSGFDVCNDDDCQRYQGSTFLDSKAVQAGMDTRGEFLVYEQSGNSSYLVPAYYYKTCGGFTENSQDIYGFDEASLCSVSDSITPIKYSNLQSKSLIELDQIQSQQFYCGQADGRKDLHKYLGKVDEGGAHFHWKRSVSEKELITNLQLKYNIENIAKVLSLNPISRSSGMRITVLDIEYENSSAEKLSYRLDTQYKIREALGPSFLPSSNFVYTKDSDGNFLFKGSGWGHGVGLCQVGALMMALAGKSYTEILQHYFPKSKLVKSY